ncbi:MAG: sigma-70 family RNA polymerase sigma factor [bacterium]|nr:sigma-70 family RNA polymerase sigma factor [bacterium]
MKTAWKSRSNSTRKRARVSNNGSQKAASFEECLKDEKTQKILRVVVGGVLKIVPRSCILDSDDFRMLAMAGLHKAWKNFEPKRRTVFQTFARFRARGSMYDELRKLDTVSRSFRANERKFQKIRIELEQKLGRCISVEDFTGLGRISPEAFRKFQREAPLSYLVRWDDLKKEVDGDIQSFDEIYPDSEQRDPSLLAILKEECALVLREVEQLPTRYRKIITLYYFKELQARKIGELFGVTEARICQIIKESLGILRERMLKFRT